MFSQVSTPWPTRPPLLTWLTHTGFLIPPDAINPPEGQGSSATFMMPLIMYRQAVSWHQAHKDEQKVSQPKELTVQTRLQMDGPFASRFGPQVCLLWPPWLKNWKLSISIGFLASFEKSEGLLTLVCLPAASVLSGCSPCALPGGTLVPVPCTNSPYSTVPGPLLRTSLPGPVDMQADFDGKN